MKPILALLLLAAPASAALSPRDLAGAVARPPAGARLPAAPTFTDRDGMRVTLPRLASGKPVVLVFADFTCRHICGPGLTLLGAALADTRQVAERDYRLVVVGLDPRDDRAAATAMAARLGPLAKAAHVLIGTPGAVAGTTRALGYGAVYDPAADQFAHDASVYVFAPDGRLSALVPELGVTGPALRAALAGSQPTGFADRVARLCYGLASAHGRYGRAAMWGVLAGAVLLLAGMAAFLWRRRAVAS